MKSLKFTVYFATIFVVFYTLLSTTEIAFAFIYFAFLIAQGLLIYMVYRILTDNYKTSRTFSDWYEDKNIR